MSMNLEVIVQSCIVCMMPISQVQKQGKNFIRITGKRLKLLQLLHSVNYSQNAMKRLIYTHVHVHHSNVIAPFTQSYIISCTVTFINTVHTQCLLKVCTLSSVFVEMDILQKIFHSLLSEPSLDFSIHYLPACLQSAQQELYYIYVIQGHMNNGYSGHLWEMRGVLVSVVHL